MVGPNRGRKEFSVKSVVYDVRRMFILCEVNEDITPLYDNDLEIFQKKIFNRLLCQKKYKRADKLQTSKKTKSETENF